VTVGPFSINWPGRADRSAPPSSGPHVVINGPTRNRGPTNRFFFQFASIGDAPQDKKYNGGAPTRLENWRPKRVSERVARSTAGTIQDAVLSHASANDNLFMGRTRIVAHDCVVGDKRK